MLIQNDKILQTIEKFFGAVQLEKSLLFRFCNFTMLQKQEKHLHSNFLQNQEQMRLNIGKKLKTASRNSRFTGS